MKNILICLIIGSCFNAFSQDSISDFKKNDISILAGLQGPRFELSKLEIQFRKSTSEKTHLKFMATIYRFESQLLMLMDTVYLSDSLIVSRTQNQNTKDYTLSFGLDHDFSKHLYGGAFVILGYAKGSNSLSDYGYEYNASNGAWEDCDSCLYEYHDEPYYSASRETNYQTANLGAHYNKRLGASHFLLYGLGLNVGVKFPILKRWEIATQYAITGIRHQALGSLSYSGEGRVYSPQSYTRFRHTVDFIVRFKV